MRDKTWIKSPWTISIGTAIFSLFLTVAYDYSKSKPILTTIWKILEATYMFIISILIFNLKVWWLIVGTVVLVAIIYLFDKFTQTESSKPDFCSYREGKFKRWRWTWDWDFNHSKNAWIISNLTAHCPVCDTPLIENVSIYGRSFECPRCDFRASQRDNDCDEPHKIERIILDNLDRKRKN